MIKSKPTMQSVTNCNAFRSSLQSNKETTTLETVTRCHGFEITASSPAAKHNGGQLVP